MHGMIDSEKTELSMKKSRCFYKLSLPPQDAQKLGITLRGRPVSTWVAAAMKVYLDRFGCHDAVLLNHCERYHVPHGSSLGTFSIAFDVDEFERLTMTATRIRRTPTLLIRVAALWALDNLEDAAPEGAAFAGVLTAERLVEAAALASDVLVKIEMNHHDRTEQFRNMALQALQRTWWQGATHISMAEAAPFYRLAQTCGLTVEQVLETCVLVSGAKERTP